MDGRAVLGVNGFCCSVAVLCLLVVIALWKSGTYLVGEYRKAQAAQAGPALDLVGVPLATHASPRRISHNHPPNNTRASLNPLPRRLYHTSGFG